MALATGLPGGDTRQRPPADIYVCVREVFSIVYLIKDPIITKLTKFYIICDYLYLFQKLFT